MLALVTIWGTKMPDQTSEVIQFIWDKYPELNPEDIAKCVDGMSEWVAIQVEKEYG